MTDPGPQWRRATPDATGTGLGEPLDAATREATRLREAYQRRGPVEARLARNRGQAAIVQERDDAIVRLLVSGARPPLDLVDVGCGGGTTLAVLRACGVLGRGVGVDLLPERVDRARAAWPDLEFLVADGTSLPFPDQSFDVALAMTVFSSVPPTVREAIATEIGRVLRPSGRFVWYDMRRPSPSNPDVRPFTGAEARRLFPGWSIVTHPVTVAPPLARRLGPLTGPAYGLLAHLPFLLTHEVGSARRRPADEQTPQSRPAAPGPRTGSTPPGDA